MKQSGHLNPSEEPSLQSMEGYVQTSMEVWVDNNITVDGEALMCKEFLLSGRHS